MHQKMYSSERNSTGAPVSWTLQIGRTKNCEIQHKLHLLHSVLNCICWSSVRRSSPPRPRIWSAPRISPLYYATSYKIPGIHAREFPNSRAWLRLQENSRAWIPGHDSGGALRHDEKFTRIPKFPGMIETSQQIPGHEFPGVSVTDFMLRGLSIKSCACMRRNSQIPAHDWDSRKIPAHEFLRMIWGPVGRDHKFDRNSQIPAHDWSPSEIPAHEFLRIPEADFMLSSRRYCGLISPQ